MEKFKVGNWVIYKDYEFLIVFINDTRDKCILMTPSFTGILEDVLLKDLQIIKE